jgi:hypothetical protein
MRFAGVTSCSDLVSAHAMNRPGPPTICGTLYPIKARCDAQPSPRPTDTLEASPLLCISRGGGKIKPSPASNYDAPRAPALARRPGRVGRTTPSLPSRPSVNSAPRARGADGASSSLRTGWPARALCAWGQWVHRNAAAGRAEPRPVRVGPMVCVRAALGRITGFRTSHTADRGRSFFNPGGPGYIRCLPGRRGFPCSC